METTSFRTPSGRRVGVTEFGDRGATRVVVFAHPAPGSSLFDPDPAATAGREVRIIALDRPGYGDSELHADGTGGTVADAAEDIAGYLSGMGIGPVGAAGWDAGGRVALALAARHPKLVDRVAVVGTTAPDEDVPWIGDDLRSALGYLRMLHRGDAVAALRDRLALTVGDDGANLLAALSPDECDANRRRESGPRLELMLDRAARQGLTGLAADVVSYALEDWGFDVAAVAAKTLLLYGAADGTASRPHALWYLDWLHDARLEMVPAAGHLLIVPMWERVLAHLAPGSKRRAP
jgi:pimeloyl-ACP methyl ester carboxylesterase